MGNFRHLIAAAAVAVGSFSGTAALAVTVTPDNFLFFTTLADSGDATELQALADFYGISVDNFQIQDKIESGSYERDDSGNWFLDVDPDEPGWFSLKFGVGQTGLATHWYFENVAELTKLVWTSSQVSPLMDNCEFVSSPGTTTFGEPCRLSHITTYIPLPAGALLLISAIAGLGLVRRRPKVI